MMNVFIFDIETVPDVASGRRLYGHTTQMASLSDEEVARMMFQRRHQETEGKSDMLRHHLQRIVAISAVLNSGHTFKVGSLCEPESDEKTLIQRFFEIIQRTTPTLISWNGSAFDLPVLHYRALLHGVPAPRYWETHGDFRFNNYLNRYHERHTDLMDVLASYQPYAFASLNEISTLLGFPGKLGMTGEGVWEAYLQGRIEDIRHYCEVDVLNTYLIYLRFEFIRGSLTEADYSQACQQVRDVLAAENKKHFNTFLEIWT
jgi:hypothetical protein